jgi:hypothetical protein
MSILHEQKSFLETNAWQKPRVNSLRYNTSQAGSVIPIIYGTTRQSVNLIALGDYRGPSGKKGKVGPLPLTGTSNVGKGGGSGSKKGTGGKKSGHYSVDVDFVICQGPVDISGDDRAWASPGVAFFSSIGLNLYTGADGQAVDPVFDGLGDHSHYSGTCHVTGTPMDLGTSPVLPNLSFEVTGFKTGTSLTYSKDANPASVVEDFLTNLRYGAGWPSINLDPNIAVANSNNYYDYCEAALFAISPALQSQTDAATWISELARLTNTAIVWSGYLLKFIPYGDLGISANNISWTPNLTPQYSFDDDDFLPWNPHIDTADPQLGDDDPVLVTRANPADATNWMSIEYLDRDNQYNKTLVPQFDQGSIDRYGLRTEASINGNCFCEKVPAENSVKLLLQRAIYIRNTYRFQVGWQYALLEPMDIVLLTDSGAGLFGQAVRITAIEENENGDLIIDAEEVQTDNTLSSGTGCADGTVDWRLSAPYFAEISWMPPDRLDQDGRLYTVDYWGAGTPNYISAYTDSGTVDTTLTYDDLWNKITAFSVLPITGHAAIYGDPYDPSGEYGENYRLWPICDGKWILAFIQRQYNHVFSFWWAVLEPGTLTCRGAYFYQGLVAWPYANGFHVLGALTEDDPILVQCYAFLGATNAVIGVLPSVTQFMTQVVGPNQFVSPQIPNTMLFPVGGATSSDTGFGENLFLAGNGTAHNQSRNFGFILPGANGPNYYIYINRYAMNEMASVPTFANTEVRDVIQPANASGAMIKIPLGDVAAPLSFSFDSVSIPDLLTTTSAFKGLPTGAYGIDNSNWLDENGAQAVPFLDEYTYISDDTVGGDDVYSAQTGVIDRGGGKFWVVFYMVGRADAQYRNGASSPPQLAYTHPIYERVRVFEYTKSTETARQIAKQTCILHAADDAGADDQTNFWEPSNDNFQIFSVTEAGRVATLYIHGYLFKKAFMTFDVPLDLST